MPFTKAELDAALSEMERRVDIKINAEIGKLQSRINYEAAENEKKREIVQEEILENVTINIENVSKEMERVSENCRRSREEFHDLREQFIQLEQALDRFRSQHAAEDISDEDPRGEY